MVQRSVREVNRELTPSVHNCVSSRVWHHLPVANLSEKAKPVLGAKGDEIEARRSIVMASIADGPSVMLIWIVYHWIVPVEFG
jgi:hypothetical protein